MLSIFQNYDEGTTEKPYGHALVAGIDRYPRKITKSMGKKKQKDRSKLKSFLKIYNFNHLMPTRYKTGSQNMINFNDAIILALIILL